MTDRSVIHSRFAIERSYLATPSRVFAAFASSGARQIWGDAGTAEELARQAGKYELDFRVGGREIFEFKHCDTTYRYDVRFYDIVADQRIICSYETYADDVRISVSVATIEFANNGDGTALVWTEQSAYLDGVDRYS